MCTCCHRMMYRKSVIQCNKSKYTKTSPDVLQGFYRVERSAKQENVCVVDVLVSSSWKTKF